VAVVAVAVLAVAVVAVAVVAVAVVATVSELRRTWRLRRADKASSTEERRPTGFPHVRKAPEHKGAAALFAGGLRPVLGGGMSSTAAW
jgi:hypothetical protein